MHNCMVISVFFLIYVLFVIPSLSEYLNNITTYLSIYLYMSMYG